MKNEKDSAGKTPKTVEWQSLPTRQYLDQTVVPILLSGLSTLAKERYVQIVIAFVRILHVGGALL